MSKRNPTQAEAVIMEIREAAKHMPESYRHYRRMRMVAGEDLLLSGIKKVGGKVPQKGVMYKTMMPIPHKINHADEMIKLYAKRREIGHDSAYKLVAEYIQKTMQQEINA